MARLKSSSPAISRQTAFVIRDSGPGIPEEVQQRIFERFYRNHQTISGSGLGLSIVQQIAALHHGVIELRNLTNPSGLELTLTLTC